MSNSTWRLHLGKLLLTVVLVQLHSGASDLLWAGGRLSCRRCPNNFWASKTHLCINYSILSIPFFHRLLVASAFSLLWDQLELGGIPV